jgi:Nif-specific regulatory protein
MRLNKPPARLTPYALELLFQYEWPGNIRELENEIERALTLAGGDIEIQDKYLSEKIRGSAEYDVLIDENETTLQEATARIERQMVMQALRKTGGNRSQAAKILGLTRQGLLNKIERYQISV